MRKDTAHVQHNVLESYHSANHTVTQIPLGSLEWYLWLTHNTVFYFVTTNGTFTARKEHRSGSWYWYAYRRVHGKLHKQYLGRSEELTGTRLTTAASVFSTLTVQKTSPPRSTQRKPVAFSADLHTTLLKTKLSVPPPRRGVIPRFHLAAQLEAVLEVKLMLVAAPAGSGKTTLVSDWCTRTKRPTAWVSLDEGDNDPTRFWMHIIEALRLILHNVGETPLLLLQSSLQPSIDAVVTALLNEVVGFSFNFVLVLDDYHLLHSPIVHQTVTFFLHHLPPQMHLIITSRIEPPLPLHRLRANGSLIELHETDLRFTFDEATSFLNGIMNLCLVQEDVTALHALTEGWITGLHLAALSLQGQNTLPHIASAFGGSHRYVVDYLSNEVLQQQSPEVQSFLLQTSLLDRLCASSCNTLMEQSSSQALLEYLERTHLFLVPLDAERHWYRYHHLFATFLRDQLSRNAPDQITSLHRRASTWYEEHGYLIEAVPHALATQDHVYAMHLIEQAANQLWMRSELLTLLGWLDSLPQDIVHTQPKLCLFYAWTLFFIGNVDMIDTWLGAAITSINTSSENTDADTGILVSKHFPVYNEQESMLVTLQACLASVRGNLQQSVELSQTALHHLPRTSTVWRSIVTLNLGAVYRCCGNGEAAHSALAEVEIIGQTIDHLLIRLSALSDLASLQMIRGQLHHASLLYQRTLHLGDNPVSRPLPPVGTAYVGLGDRSPLRTL